MHVSLGNATKEKVSHREGNSVSSFFPLISPHPKRSDSDDF